MKRKPVHRQFDQLTLDGFRTIVGDYDLGEFVQATTLVVEGGRVVLLAEKSETSRKYAVTTTTGLFFLKEVPWYCDDARSIEFSAYVATHLTARGLPLPAIIPTRRGGVFTQLGDSNYVLYEYRSGANFDRSAGHVRSAGAFLGRVSSALERCDVSGREARRESARIVVEQHLDIADRVSAERGDTHIDLVAVRRAIVGDLSDERGEQPVHGDYIPWNLAYDAEGEVCALYDLDNSCLGSPLRDLGKAISSFHYLPYAGTGTGLTTLSAEPGSLPDAGAFLRAYEAWRPLDTQSRRELPGYVLGGFAASILLSVIRGEQGRTDTGALLGWFGLVRDSAAALVYDADRGVS